MLNTPNVLSQLPLGILRQYFKNPLSRPLLVTLFWIMSWIRLHGKANFIHFLIAVRLRSLVIKKETTQSTAKQTITSSSELFQGIHFRGLIAFTRFSTTLCIIVIWKNERAEVATAIVIFIRPFLIRKEVLLIRIVTCKREAFLGWGSCAVPVQ